MSCGKESEILQREYKKGFPVPKEGHAFTIENHNFIRHEGRIYVRTSGEDFTRKMSNRENAYYDALGMSLQSSSTTPSGRNRRSTPMHIP